ncbi:hypothetical protein HWV62_30591 [Athelia sp. TMB]|nr:hypothetical protein HWV62_30591 [Athelia sp. TMB]
MVNVSLPLSQTASSEGHNTVKHPYFDTDDVFNQGYSNEWTLCGLTKLAKILHAKALQGHLDTQGAPIIVTAIHPGMAMSGTSLTPSSFRAHPDLNPRD